MNNKLIPLLKKAIELSGPSNKDFTEIQLSNTINISPKELIDLIGEDEFKLFFSLSKKSRIKCLKCGTFIDYDSGLDFSFCPNCNNENDLSNVGLYSIGLNRKEVEIYFIEHLSKIFEDNGWEIRDSDDNFIVIKKSGIHIAFSINLDENGLKEYFTLRGWASDYSAESYVLISTNFDKFLSAYKDKDPKCYLSNVFDIFDRLFIEEIINEVTKRAKVSTKEEEAEKILDIEFKKFGELPKLLEDYSNLIKLLPARALHKTSEPIPRQGKKFEKDIVKILNFTILRTKYAGGSNEPDGIGIVSRYNNEKNVWFPMEIKTFTPNEENNGFFPLNDAIRQIDKYSNSLENEEIREFFKIPAFIVIAYDFDINSEKVKVIIEEFQRKHNSKLVMIPLKSIIKIFTNFQQDNIHSLPSDIIEKFFLKSNYITEEQVDSLFKELNKYNKEKYSNQMKLLRNKTKNQGK